MSSEWISVEDRLPSDQEKYMVYTKQGSTWTGNYNLPIKENDWILHGWTTSYGIHPFDVTHWAQLPQPPKDSL